MPEFHPDRPKNPRCPPENAASASGTIWRGVRELPLAEKDFLSHAELELPNCDKENCEHWGLSVWISEAAVHHARGLHPYMRRWHVASGNVDASDGKIMPTPRPGGDPNHHTFWKFHNHTILAKFEITLPPLPKKKQKQPAV